MRKILSVGVISALIIACSSQTSSKIPTVNSEREVSVEKIEMAPAIGETESEEIVDKSCPEGMVHIQGEYCPKDDAKCLYYTDLDQKKTNIDTDRCGEWRYPVHCLASTVHKDFCIDRYEYPNKKGEIPLDWVSFNKAKRLAEENGKRLCTHSEWAFAALGSNNHPYPFGDGFKRDRSCNIDRHTGGINVFNAKEPNDETAIKIRKVLVPSGSLPNCISNFGVYDMSGNEDEWVINESGRPYISGLMGGMAYGVRNRSRAMTIAHGPTFAWYETNFRECSDIQQ